jgi:uncharacterized phage-associated protein
MTCTSESTYKKATQALNFLAVKKEGKINKMKAIKLIYLADRLHLRKYGRPIVGDLYWAMKLGPVGSCTKNIAERKITPSDSPKAFLYARKYLKPIDEKKQEVVSLREPDMSVFSKTDLDCLEAVYREFADRDQFELAILTHLLPEWRKYDNELKEGKKRVRMDYKDLFSDKAVPVKLFDQSKEQLEQAKELFLEREETTQLFES